ncbi:MAG TPA: HAMP domain-containing sensor histidine kinase [Solirubrobacteraceae bacterium]|nr:HAMP domain-containing sensor histidine kinase [Solirubrobacteraceae bacterium]
MSFERRVTLSAALAVTVAVLLAALASYVIVRQEFHQAVAKSLTISFRSDKDRVTGRFGRPFTAPAGASGPTAAAPQLTHAQRLRLLLSPRRNGIGVPGIVELVSAAGKVTPAFGITRAQEVRASSSIEQLARSGTHTLDFTSRMNGTDYEVLAGELTPGVAIVIDRSLSEQDATLAHLRVVLLVVAAIGIALAALLGWFVARTTVAPVRRLTAAAEHVAATNDLAARIDETRRDELGSLARSFNAMLGALDGTMRALDESARAQRQLVADASHELRTPVTSLRTNIEFLQQSESLEPDAHRRLVSDVVTQLEELSELVSDLIELARDDEQITEPPEEVRLDVLVSEAIERAQLHAPQARFDVKLEPTVVSAVPSRLGRAVNNLLDNAVKFAGTEAPIEVRLEHGELAIRDHGPGIDPEELPHVFDRFFRGSRSRALPGSGLGLAIVRQVAERHAGTVSAGPAPGGGTIVRLQMPVVT